MPKKPSFSDNSVVEPKVETKVVTVVEPKVVEEPSVVAVEPKTEPKVETKVVEPKTEPKLVEQPSVVVVERPILCLFTRWFSQRNY